ncbi:MAG: hypothetical protein AAF519_00490 [Bacteroidota bacterium]
MIRWLLFLLINLTLNTVLAQNQYKWQLGISTGISETSKDQNRNWVVSPKASYQLSKRFMLFSEGHYLKDIFSESGEEKKTTENSLDGSYLFGFGGRYQAIISKKCGILFIGSSLNYDFVAKETLLFITPCIYYELGKLVLDLSFDISSDQIFQNNLFISSELGLNVRL